METVEVVIKIPKKCKEFLDNGGKVDWLDAIPIIDAIANGTVLPKGHGALVDKDKLLNEFGCEDEDIFAKSVIESVNPVIEADRGDENV